MSRQPGYSLRKLNPGDVALHRSMLAMFGEVFEDVETYTGHPPPAEYINDLLANPQFIALAAIQDEMVIGALAAYELPKFEQQRNLYLRSCRYRTAPPPRYRNCADFRTQGNRQKPRCLCHLRSS
jgi:hypothetical protein